MREPRMAKDQWTRVGVEATMRALGVCLALPRVRIVRNNVYVGVTYGNNDGTNVVQSELAVRRNVDCRGPSPSQHAKL